MKYAVIIIFCLMAIFLAVSQGYAETGQLVPVRGGTFIMGSPETEHSREADESQHRVTLQDFYLGKYPVTRLEYVQLMHTDPSGFDGDNLPVEGVSWLDAVRFCNERSKAEGLTPAYVFPEKQGSIEVLWNRSANGYRLPTEAEWEYACRAGTATPFHTGENITTNQANYYGTYPYKDAPRGQYRNRPVPVDTFPANDWGLYGMHGNVWEWCWDWYGEYPSGAQHDPSGPSSGSFRVNRGGGWNDFGRHLRSAYRAAHPPLNKTFNLGFRVARNTESKG